jgi:hypothetical protein
MPVVPYYQGRPAGTWVTAMSGPTRAAAANPADDTSPVSRQPAASVAWRRIPVETSAHAAASASAWETWASNLLPLVRIEVVATRRDAGRGHIEGT